MDIKHDALIDLEEALTRRMRRGWNRYWQELSLDIGKAIDAGDFDKAHALIDTLTLNRVVKKIKVFAKTIGTAALLLGAGRVQPIRKTNVFEDPPKKLLATAHKQMELVLGQNAANALRLAAHLYLDQHASDALIQKATQLQAPSKGLRALVNARATGYMAVASSLYTSRLNSLGYLLEADAMGIETYQVNEVLDRATCAVCSRMHGKTFAVKVGLAHVIGMLSTDDPDVLKHMAPWPKNTKAGVAALGRMSTADLVDAGFQLPPYHPRCRGIVVSTGQVDLTDAALGFAAGAAAGNVDATDSEALGNHLFGDRADMEAASAAYFAAGGQSALFTAEDIDTEADDGHDEEAGGSLFLLGLAAGAAAETKLDP